MPEFHSRWERLRERIDDAARRSGRPGASVTVIAVTKGVSPERIREAREAGVAAFGENKVQEAAEKIPQFPEAEWHLIGHLQSNKIPSALELFHVIQSVDTVNLAKRLGQEALAKGRDISVLLEVNLSGEAKRYGFAPDELYSALDEIAAIPNVRVSGLMGMAPHPAEPEKKREAFRTLKNLFGACKSMKRANVEMKHLSMGMSDDFEIAVEEGSTMVRVGRALFS